METSVLRTALLYLAVASTVVAAFALEAIAQETTQVSEMPKFLFVVERNQSMDEHWSGDPEQPTRWDVVVDAIIAAANSAPAGTQFAVMTTDRNGWYAVSSFAHPNVHMTRALIAAPLNYIGTREIGNALDGVVREYLTLSIPGDEDDEWGQMPFAEPCSTIEVIVLSDGAGDGNDTDPLDMTFGDDVIDGYRVDGGFPISETSVSLLDDAAYYAANTDLSSYHSGMQTVRTHTVLLDARMQISTLPEELFVSAASVGGGLYTRAEEPADVALGISLAMTDAMQSVLNVSASITTAVGHRMFRTWTEIPAGVDGQRGAPLHQGHIEAFQLINRPGDPRYGEINGEVMWDAAELLTQRRAEHRGKNSYAFGCAHPEHHERTLFTNPPRWGTFLPRDMIPFDASTAERLGWLMLPDFGTSNFDYYLGCTDYPDGDLNHDCRVDTADAQLAIDFLRGVPEATFAGTTPQTRRERGAWRVGGMFLSTPAFSNTQNRRYTDDLGMYSFQKKLAEKESVLFVPSNAGFLHAFKVPYMDGDKDGWEDYTSDPTGGWELWAYIPRHLLDHTAPFHEDFHSAMALLRDGESYLNDGSVNLSDVWMDGVPNYLDAECTSAEPDARVDSDGCEYHRVLVASMGMGSRYHYALDVTDPRRPRFLWEWVGDLDGWRKGMGTGTPLITSVYSATTNSDVPVVIWSSGTDDVDDNVPDRPRWPVPSQRQGQQPGVGSRWYMFDLLNPPNPTFSQVGYRIDESLSDYTRDADDPRYAVGDAAAGVFGTPAAVDFDEDGNVDALYMGTRHGAVIKVLLDSGELSATTMENATEGAASTCVFHGPAAILDAQDTITDQYAVYNRPSVTRDRSGLIRVTWATGWPGNLGEPYESGHVFSVVDGSSPGDEWTCQEATTSACGAHLDPLLLDPGEKVVGPIQTYGGKMMFTTYIADNAEAGPACGIGHTRVYALDVDDCDGGYVSGRDWGPRANPVTNSMYTEFEGIPSTMSFANRGIYLNVVLPDGAMRAIGPIRPEPLEYEGDRITYASWRIIL